MSYPISNCVIVKATSNEKIYQILLALYACNIRHGAYIQTPCRHKPRCHASAKKLKELRTRLKADLRKLPVLNPRQIRRATKAEKPRRSK